ncbi:MAG: 2-oxoglutarate dehydrogenase E1 component, partial [Candidatus Margulisbacteria bacterium]|nr:2-oxoglutarate dehydrogenase E1 component [Candidatus Margulisiibacteriota bacterium]
MDKYSYINNANGAFVEDLYDKYQKDPASVDPSWQKFFEGFEFSKSLGPVKGESVSNKEISVVKLINAYRSRGHLISDTNPVRKRRPHKADLTLDYFGLTEADLDTVFDAGMEISIGTQSLRKILDHLEKTYCHTIGVEFMYCRDEKLRQWLYQEMEPIANQPKFTPDESKYILEKITQSVTFEKFIHTKYVGKKRFSLEGLESLIPSLDVMIRQSAELGTKEFIIGMAHRGRLNVLAHIFGKAYEDVFSEFEEYMLPKDIKGSGDVKYHLGRSADIKTRDGHKIHLSLLPNPSHLESVNPVVQGNVYAKKLEVYGNDAKKIVPVLIHGDAAYSGQGVNYEVAHMSKLEGYGNGGTIHIVLNNQIGFTTNYKEGRSSVYCTDIAKVTESPVFHVNADDPFAVTHAMRMAVKIRQEFHIDVYVAILGYRR